MAEKTNFHDIEIDDAAKIATTDVGTLLLQAAAPGGVAPKTGYKWLCGVTATPSKATSPEKLEATELHHLKKRYEKGREDSSDVEYEIQHTAEKATKLRGLKGTNAFLEIFPEGDGYLIVGESQYDSDGVGLNSIHKGKLSIVPQSMEYLGVEEVAALVKKD